MTSYTAPARDIAFVLHDVLKVAQSPIPGYSDLEPAFTSAVLDEAGRLASEVLHPLNAVGDRQGCRLENGTVRTPDGFRAAYETMREGGWMGLDCDPEYGGQGMPYVLNTAVGELFVAANMAFNMYQGLTHGAYSAIRTHGSDDQKRTYLPRMVDGSWTGTMNLTEPQCGTDLGLLRTRAEPAADGSYAITGQKIFISAGDHDLSENVIHLVLAKAPGGGEGTKGISLFIVPKFLPGPDGTSGERNRLSVGKIETKMGIHGNATCVMDYDGARGWLLGELHKGMRAMFTMMNEARLGVGLQGYAIAEVACQNALAYARDRRQGRAVPAPADPDEPADLLIVHPDIRRSLMNQRSFIEGARALTLWGASLIDAAHRSGDDGAEALIGLLTPVIKGFQTDRGFECCVEAQQIWGGHGYIEENGMSQFARDARIAMIYEGANGIQALDLVARKLAQDGGKAFMRFLAEIERTIRDHAGDAALKADFLDPLAAASKDLRAAAQFFMQTGLKHPEAALAGATDFLHLCGHTALGLMWARMAAASSAALAAGTADTAFHKAKLATGRFYMTRQLPATALHLARITSGADPVMALAAEAF